MTDLDSIIYDGEHDLLKAAVKVMGLDQIEMQVHSDVPPGCGTGSSAAVSVAMLGALGLLAGRYQRPHEVARLAHELETKELKIESGVQDQIAAAVGGIGYHDIYDYPFVSSTPVRLAPTIIWELESRLLVVYSGARHLSSDVHRKVVGDLEAGRPEALTAMETLRQTPQKAADALWRGDFDTFAEVMNENNAAQAGLHADIVSADLARIEEVARAAGAIGFKINGAGGGGSATLLCKAGARRDVETAVKEAGYQALNCHLDFQGLRVWVSQP
jgi:D-glycero-alpha-D-manno-heptose-7-phosphate kinase